jgi:hypothetical protein
MSVSIKQLTEQAFALPASEREILGSSLLESVHNKELTEIDREWIALAEERFQDLVKGVDAGIPEADFFAKAKDRMGWN